MLAFISVQMPLTDPGSLPASQYAQVLCFILLSNNYVTPSTIYNPSTLSSITWK
jgi:hypothetical protein